MITIIARLSHRTEEREYWRAELPDGTILDDRCASPFCDGARALLAKGVDPATPVTLRMAGSEVDSFLPARLGYVASLRVKEVDYHSARFAAWESYPEEMPRSVARTPRQAPLRAWTYP